VVDEAGGGTVVRPVNDVTAFVINEEIETKEVGRGVTRVGDFFALVGFGGRDYFTKI
jgi:hypothetical protein